MVEPNWGMIRSGPTFEALVSMLVFYKDPQAKLFGRRGKDGGQDVRSGDGSMVYQAKFHSDENPSHAFSDAKSELKKIVSYRTLGHVRYEQWLNVTHWKLVTNVMFNTTDEQRWTREIVPLFAENGLTAVYWTKPYLDGLLAMYPEIQRMFFEGENRVFLTPFEAEERLHKEISSVDREGLPIPPFVGRQEVFEELRNFLQTETLFLALNGPGGVGKSRLLVEFGQEIAGKGEWLVLWGLLSSMEQSAAWFQGIMPERPTLLLLDEPENERLLRILEEQLGNRLGRATRWKAVIAARSSKDPILRYLRHLSKIHSADPIALHPLDGKDSKAMCLGRLSQGPLANQPEEWRLQAAQQLAQLYNGYPVWLNLAISFLERDGDLSRISTEAEGLADQYLEEILGPSGTSEYESTLALLRWIALIGPVNREDNEAITNLAKQTGISSSQKVQEIITSLVARCALFAYGAYNRLVAIKPDIIREHLLLRWLVVNLGFGRQRFQLSDNAQNLIQELTFAIRQGTTNSHQRRILVSLTRTEWLLQRGDQPLALLDQFFIDLQQGIPAMSPSQRISMIASLSDIAEPKVGNILEIVRSLRQNPASTEKIVNLLGDRRTMGQDEVLLELPWLLYLAARGELDSAHGRNRLLSEMSELVLEEIRIGHRSNLPRDGRRASELLRRIHGGGPDFMVSFDEEILPLALHWIGGWLRDPSLERSEALKEILKPVISLEREQIFREENTIRIRRNVMLRDDPCWQPRQQLLQQIRDLLQNDSLLIEQRCVLWELLDYAHHNLLQATRSVGTELFKEEIQGDLFWALNCLQNQKKTELVELQAARKVWFWHVRFDENTEICRLAEQLEDIYQENELAAEFEPLVDYDVDDPDSQEQRQQHKAEFLAELSGGDEIARFIERAVQFIGQPSIHPIWEIGIHLGRLAPSKPVVGEYLETVFSKSDSDYQLDFATWVVSSWVKTLRQEGEEEKAWKKCKEFFDQCSHAAAQIWLLQRTYSRRNNGLAPGEYQWLLSQSQLYQKAGRLQYWFELIAQNLDRDFKQFRCICESTLKNLPYKDQPSAVSGLIEGIYRAICDRQHQFNPDLSLGLGVWLLDQVVLVNNLSDVSALRDHGDRLFKKLGRAPISWLAVTLAKRKEREEEAQGKERFYAVSLSDRVRLSRFVEPVQSGNRKESEVVSAVERLVDFTLAKGSFNFGFNGYLKDIDPEGFIIPDIVVNRLAALPQNGEIYDNAACFAKIALEYQVGSVSWRRIASAVVALTKHFPPSEREHLWEALVIPTMSSWSTTLGQVPQVFIDEARNAREFLDAETEECFRPFWGWYVKYTEEKLRDKAERIKEDHDV